ncbi:MAG: hypothetical protein QOI70_1113 [Microbacteriaceae bacterium]|nr:hypothetical protein [Microbacteriaceae bacterium]
MPDPGLVFERVIALPRAIVWDAVTDPDLIWGWLAEVRLFPDRPRAFELLWPGPSFSPPTRGSVTRLQPPALVEVDTDNRGCIRIALRSIEGGPRGSSTIVRIVVTPDIEPAFSGRVREEWERNLDRLDGLLRGHPIDRASLRAADPSMRTK